MPASQPGGRWWWRPRTAMPLAALALLSACKDEKQSAAQATASLTERVWQATQEAMRGAAGSPQQMAFRGVRVYPQAIPQRMAVCGQLDPFADDPGIFVPFVTIVTIPDSPAAPYQFDPHVGRTPSEASQVYLAIVNYCYDKGGPAPGPNPGVMRMAPLPDAIPDPSVKIAPTGVSPAASSAAPRTPPLPPGAAADQTAASGSVTMRQNGNLHADPHGPVTRVVSAGTAMRVFATAPGGWYQVGDDTAPWGWVHQSMLQGH